MKKIHQLFVSIILLGLLSISVFAGDGIMTTGKTDPPPPPAVAAEADGIIQNGKAASADPGTEVVLSLLQSVLALF
ncbi:MAG TPA: hypothetical protein VGW12_09720 [Pyrinomonadaceae bacterium]|nr:hypothetical protein [Pyrinomonadaceae bacterium]